MQKNQINPLRFNRLQVWKNKNKEIVAYTGEANGGVVHYTTKIEDQLPVFSSMTLLSGSPKSHRDNSDYVNDKNVHLYHHGTIIDVQRQSYLKEFDIAEYNFTKK